MGGVTFTSMPCYQLLCTSLLVPVSQHMKGTLLTGCALVSRVQYELTACNGSMNADDCLIQCCSAMHYMGKG